MYSLLCPPFLVLLVNRLFHTASSAFFGFNSFALNRFAAAAAAVRAGAGPPPLASAAAADPL